MYRRLSDVSMTIALSALLLASLAGCHQKVDEGKPKAETSTPTSAAASKFLGQAPSPAKTQVFQPPTTTKQWTGDLDALLKHRVIRVGVPYSKTFFYQVKGAEHGIAYDMGKEFEAYLNKKYPQKRKNIKIEVLIFAATRDKVLSNLNGGTLDIVGGGIIVTPERQKQADFSDSTFKGANEIVVTAPGAPNIFSVNDLSGKAVFVRKSSAYWEQLTQLNQRFQTEKKPPVNITVVPDDLADEDILEMVNAGLLSTTVVADWTVKLWSQMLTKMQAHPDVVIAPGVAYGWAVRKNSPQLLAAINDFLKTHRQGTAFGRQLVDEYVNSPHMLKQAVSPESMKRFEHFAQIFRKYSDQYSMDYLLMMAEGYQESGLNQQVTSRVGAIGVMQVMPDTGQQMKVGDIHHEDANIHAGVKYFNTTMNELYGNEPMDDLNKVLFAFAAYNCGPMRVKELRAEAARKGLDPNVWINNVEFIAAARVGRETVDYVSNIYKYYVAYKLIAVQEEQRQKALKEVTQKK